jgi:hypothetical protein
MTVREMMAALAQMDPDAVVRMPDTYWESEGYGPHADDLEYLMPRVGGVAAREGFVEVFAADGEDEDEDEEDWDDDEED